MKVYQSIKENSHFFTHPVPIIFLPFPVVHWNSGFQFSLKKKPKKLVRPGLVEDQSFLNFKFKVFVASVELSGDISKFCMVKHCHRDSMKRVFVNRRIDYAEKRRFP